MRWRGGRQSRNIEDRRGLPLRGGMVAGGGIGVLVLVVLGLFLGVDPSVILSGGGVDTSPRQAERRTGPPAADPVRDFVSVVLADTEDTWSELFQRADRTYEAPTLVLFTRAVQSACGLAGAAVGPFYCPGDRKLYLDVGFFQELRDRFRAPGDFAQAYVIAHEVGHHVQTLLGVTDRIARAGQRASATERNALSVRLELQADCFAGVWGHHAERARDLLEAGDIEEGMRAAAAIGDDRLQRQSGGHVAPESFTHGTSAQRVRWFRRGLDSGQPRECDTFTAAAQP